MYRSCHALWCWRGGLDAPIPTFPRPSKNEGQGKELRPIPSLALAGEQLCSMSSGFNEMFTKFLLFFQHRIQDRNEFTHARGQGHLMFLAYLNQPVL